MAEPSLLFTKAGGIARLTFNRPGGPQRGFMERGRPIFEARRTLTPASDPTLDAVDITSMARYLEHGYPWADWDLLRDLAPIYRYEGRPRFGPFWAVTRHRDIR